MSIAQTSISTSAHEDDDDMEELYDQLDRAGKVAWIRQILVALGDWITKVAQTHPNNRKEW